MAAPTIDLLQGSLDAIILKTLSWQPVHGFGIARRVERATDDMLRVEEGSLYPALYRMENKGWIKSEWGITENNRRAKYYRLTSAGRRRLAELSAAWDRYSAMMTKIMSATAPAG